MTHDGNESITIAVVDEGELDDAIELLRAAPDDDGFEGPSTTLSYAFGYGQNREVSTLIEAFAALPWERPGDDEGVLVLTAEDVAEARSKVRKIIKDPERFARRLAKVTEDPVEAAEVEALGDEPSDAESTWERLAQVIRQLARMMRKAEAAGEAIVVVFGSE